MRTHATSCMWETNLQYWRTSRKCYEIHLQYWDFPLLKSNFSHTKSNFPKLAFCFLQRLSNFFNGFPLFSMAFRFLQWLSDVPQRLSNFPQWLSDFPQRLSSFWEIQENLFTAASIRKITIIELRITRHSLPELHNCHSLPELCNRHSLPELRNCHSLPELCNCYNVCISSNIKSDFTCITSLYRGD